MHRRQFLGVLGASAIAGCAGQTAPTDDAATTAEASPTPTETRTTTEASTERSDERSLEEAESTPTYEQRLIQRGRDHLAAAIEAFTAAEETDDATIVDVTAASSGFSRFEVDKEYRAAVEALTKAKERTTDEEAAEVARLLETAEFIYTLGFAQVHLVNAYERMNVVVRTFYNESYGKLPDDVADVHSQRRSAAGYVETIRDDFDESTVGSVDFVTGAQLAAKVEQMESELATFEGLVTHLDGLGASMDAFEGDVRKYTTGQYEGVAFASKGFEDVRDGLASIEPADSLESIVAELACLLEALADGTRTMQTAVLARRNGETATAQEYEADAEAAFRSCDQLIEEVKPVSDLVESL